MIPKSSFCNNNLGFGSSELRVYDMTHIRLSNVSLSYNLPAMLIDKTPFRQVTVTVSGDNLYMFAPNIPKGSGIDPSLYSMGGNWRGFDFNTGATGSRIGGSVNVRF